MHCKKKISGMLAVFATLSAVLLISGCRSIKEPTPIPDNALKIGVSSDYPPVAFKQQGKLAGIEIELARKLAGELGRPARFVELKWDEQIKALLSGKIDIIMSGLTVTDTRKVRIDFTEPYLELGLMALVRIKDLKKFEDPETLFKSFSNFGVQKGATAETFVRKKCAEATSITWLNPEEAPFYLTTGQIDVYIHDGPGIIWLASENDTELAALKFQLNTEKIAWGINKSDQKLKNDINRIIASWKADGTLKKIITRWLPDII